MNVLNNLKYTKNHEWVLIEGSIATIGITEHAQRELGDIVYLDIDTVDQELNIDDVFGSVEAVKTVSDLFMPVSGKVLEFNDLLDVNPELVNQEPYGKGWIIKVEINKIYNNEELLSPDAYREIIGL
jgi:glycine cleavage system H protein